MKSVISDQDALKLLRADIDPNRHATEIDWEKARRAFGDALNKKPPKGAFTARDLATEFKTTEARVFRKLKKDARAGKLMSGKFHVPGVSGITTFFWWSNKK